LREGVRLALTTFSVAPVRVGRVDRRTAAVAMALAPLVGAALGAVAAGVGLGLRWLAAPALLAAVGAVGVLALLTRGLHLDGLADSADALGAYGDRERALAVMKAPDVGAFGVATLILVLLAQVAAVAALLDRARPAALVAVVVAVAAGRLAVPWACRHGVPAARPTGLGALVAGTVPRWAVGVATLAVGGAAVAAVPGRPWQGPLTVLAVVAGTLVLIRHAVRRFGGVTGDVLGAVVELASTLALVGLTLGGS
jgi:adenosylcobinamide-GDP ribazoletransferase